MNHPFPAQARIYDAYIRSNLRANEREGHIDKGDRSRDVLLEQIRDLLVDQLLGGRAEPLVLPARRRRGSWSGRGRR